MLLRNSASQSLAAEVVKSDAASFQVTATPIAASPFTDFPGLIRHLPMYGERTLRALVKRKIIPAVRLPGTRKLGFHLPTVDAALLRYQKGGLE